jgi:hypothetical protein
MKLRRSHKWSSGGFNPLTPALLPQEEPRGASAMHAGATPPPSSCRHVGIAYHKGLLNVLKGLCRMYGHRTVFMLEHLANSD